VRDFQAHIEGLDTQNKTLLAEIDSEKAALDKV
jgi:hypothetical protein